MSSHIKLIVMVMIINFTIISCKVDESHGYSDSYIKNMKQWPDVAFRFTSQKFIAKTNFSKATNCTVYGTHKFTCNKIMDTLGNLQEGYIIPSQIIQYDDPYEDKMDIEINVYEWLNIESAKGRDICVEMAIVPLEWAIEAASGSGPLRPNINPERFVMQCNGTYKSLFISGSGMMDELQGMTQFDYTYKIINMPMWDTGNSDFISLSIFTSRINFYFAMNHRYGNV